MRTQVHVLVLEQTPTGILGKAQTIHPVLGESCAGVALRSPPSGRVSKLLNFSSTACSIMTSSSLQEWLQEPSKRLQIEADTNCCKSKPEVALLNDAVVSTSALLEAVGRGGTTGSETVGATRAKLEKRVYFQIAQCASLGPDSPVAVVAKALRFYEVEELDALFQRCLQELARLPLREGRTPAYVACVRDWLEALQSYAQRYREGACSRLVPEDVSTPNTQPETATEQSGETLSFAAPTPPPTPAADEGQSSRLSLEKMAPGTVSTTAANREALLSQIEAAGDAITTVLRPTRAVPAKAPAATEPVRCEPAPPVTTVPTQQKSHESGETPLLLFERTANRWRIEHFRALSAEPLQVSICHPRETVYVYRCEKQSIKIRNKCNTLMLDACRDVVVLFESVVSAVEFVRCSKCRLHFTGCVPSISIDNCDSIVLYGMPGQVITCCATAVTIVEPDGDTERETPIPQQFITRRQSEEAAAAARTETAHRWVTEPLKHSGAE